MKTNSQSFEQEVIQSNVPVLVDFFAEWCGPCKMLAPALDTLEHNFAGRAKIVKVDVDESADLADKFAVQAVPTLLLFNHGQVTQRISGLVPLRQLTALLDGVVPPANPTA